jgi:cullin-associated NEDD8-dissociated protein 1
LLAAISDPSDEIKVIRHMLLVRLSASSTTSIAIAQRLDELTSSLEVTMCETAVTKDTVKQDIERAAELRRSTMRAVVALSKIDSASSAPKFDAFVEESRKNEQRIQGVTWSLKDFTIQTVYAISVFQCSRRQSVNRSCN